MYWIFLVVPGGLLLIVGLITAAPLWLGLGGVLLLIWPFMLKDWRWLAALLGIQLLLRLIMDDASALEALPWMGLGAALMGLVFETRCPRCELTTLTRERYKLRYCLACGRDCRTVWPGQYRLRPEVWDGEYRDEGGGPPSEGLVNDIEAQRAIWRSKKGLPPF